MNCDELKRELGANNNAHCFSASSSAKEGGKRILFSNPNKKNICRAHIDGCFINENSLKKCDYLFNVSDDDSYYLVELKGKDIDTAVEQIVSTFEIINTQVKKSPQNYQGIIVSSSVPAGTEQKFRKLQEKYYKEKRLKIKKTHFQHVEKV